MRPPTACVACRQRRRKCVTKSPKEKCERCLNLNLSCSLSTSPAPINAPGGTALGDDILEADLSGWQDGGLGIELPPQPLCTEIVELYFQYIHDPTHSLFHRPTFMRDLADDAVPLVLLLCILALAARFSTNPYFSIDPRNRGQAYIREAERLFDLHDLSEQTLRAALLLGTYYGTEGDPQRENLYYTVASRLGLLLNVPKLPSPDTLGRELHVRLWWTLVMADVWSSTGVQLPRQLNSRQDVPMPTDEFSFMAMRRGEGESLSLYSPVSPVSSISPSSSSLLSQMVLLNSIFAEIAEMNRTAARDRDRLSDMQLDATITVLAQKLDDWHTQLPVSLRDTSDNLEQYAAAGLGGMFTSIYLGYYHYLTLLYFQYLDHTKSYSGRSSYRADMCRASSSALCDITYRSNSLAGAEVFYSMVGHVLVIASVVQLHILLFSHDDDQVAAARNRLERNFGILTRMQSLWPALDHSFNRFKKFHDECMKARSNGSEVFRLDKWMLQFLLEFATPIGEKPVELISPWLESSSLATSSTQFSPLP